ncbi:MAG: class I SAM-dependent methyltransferase [Janthinobacterium lividum]
MNFDISDICKFYQTRLGQTAYRYIDHKITQFWSDGAGDVIVGYGYATPYIDRYLQTASRVIGLMPCSQGAIPWPKNKANLVALTPADYLPLLDNSVDRILMVHALEHSDNPSQLFREAWRVLVDGGRLLIIVPNRRGFWARNPLTPFGHGKPYSGRQLFGLMEKSLFTPYKPKYALFAPPLNSKVLLQFSDSFEHLGSAWIKKWGGVTLMETSKQIASLSLESPRTWRPSIFVPTPIPTTDQLCDHKKK